MRTEKEMFDLILDFARNDDRVRAVILNGSRANPNARRDRLQDFDIVYIVNDVDPFLSDPHWIDPFGERMVMQLPDEMDEPGRTHRDHFAYLMQFSDGNRIDLTLVTRAYYDAAGKDSLTLLLLDKDGTMPAFPPPDESDYLPQPPGPLDYFNCCNEFWWVSPYVAKGLRRRELPYAKAMLDTVLRGQLTRMLTWYIGIRTDFKVNPGKEGKYFERCLEPELWEMLKRTYSGADYGETRAALFAAGELFRRVARPVAAKFGYEYPEGEDERVSEYIRQI